MTFVDISMDLHNHKSSAVQKLALTQIGLIFSLFSVVNSSNNTFAYSVANMNQLTPIVLPSASKQTATVIFFHGLGDSGLGWSEAMSRISQAHVKIICPSATPMPVTLNRGFRMPSWFDLFTLDESGPEDDEGIKKAAKMVHSLIDHEVEFYNIPSSRIALGGFSQGGALALYSAFTYGKPLAGVMALSCWIPLHKTFPAAAISNKDMPIIQCHGDCDPVVPLKWGQLTASILKSFNKNTEFKTFRAMMHSSCDAEIKDLKKFMDVILPRVD